MIFNKIKFIDSNYDFIMKILTKKRGYLVIPAASSLATIQVSKNYKLSLQQARLAIFDSGFFCLSLIFLKFKIFKKFSGYKFIKFFLNDNNQKNKKILLLDPNLIESKKNYLLMKTYKFKFIKNYVCPHYSADKMQDSKLINLVNKYKPEIILINIAGGVQEPLARYLENNINFRLISVCSGAAISFFTGAQAPITDLVDKLYLGWLYRIIYNPRNLARVISSLKLFIIIINSKIFIKKI